MKSDPVTKKRCAVYTRKSTEEGLQQEFNSLDAQREACEAYVASQRSEGWALVPDRYDDGGWSGGNLDRPGLQRLLSDIALGRVDVVVCYKIDRLSRSLMDFAKLVEVFDRRQVTFVSVTQSFNTTTSMGRLTLNVLLSFAQFEREVTAERIRDKFAASRARGMWMGGWAPLGYDVNNRKLIVNEAEAETVRMIFDRFAKLGSLIGLTRELTLKGVQSKRGRPIDKGSLLTILHNRVYLGDAVHKGTSHRGEHAAIVPDELWAKAHSVFTRSPRARAGASRADTALLRGLIFTAEGRAMSPSHTRRNGRLYRYYVSQAVLKHGADGSNASRVPAGEIERAVVDQLRRLIAAPETIAATIRVVRLRDSSVCDDEIRDALQRLDPLWEELFPAEQARIVQLVVERVTVAEDGLEVRLRTAGLASMAVALQARERRAA